MKITLILFLLVLGLWACKKDKTGPLIYIQGANPYVHYLGEMYRDPGALAVDPETGDVSGSIKTESNLNPDAVGEYFIRYRARDKFRNYSQNSPVRKVRVKLNAKFLVGYYRFEQKNSDTSSVIKNFDFITYQNDSLFSFYNFTNIDSVYVNARLFGFLKDSVEIPLQIITRKGITYQLSGKGKFSSSGKELNIHFTRNTLSGGPVQAINGTIRYTRFFF